jgi:hypothetical protein|uniref:Uncharacterized protein n=1 Tax=viral metagenome TaxID=1070528 RepID=A0A6C0CDS4_9ZZZZ
MLLLGLCGPALVYIGFSLIQIFIDIYAGVFNSAFLKFVIMIIFTLIINILCSLGFTVIAWVLVFIPIIMMTIISTLLLRVFGLDPDQKDLRQNLNSARDVSLNKFDITDTELLNQQQYSYLYDKFRNENRIDRDSLRKDFYDKVDITFDLSRNSYDLSKNPTKYFIVNSIVNRLAEQSFIKDIVNSRLYNSIFSNKAKYNNDLYNNYIGTLSGNSSLPNNAFLGLPMAPVTYGSSILLSEGETISGEHVKYGTRYNSTYKLNGFLKFKESKYNSIKTQLYGTNPNVDNAKIDIEIERLWNRLSAAEQATWNGTTASTGVNSISYDYYNLNNLQEARNRVTAQSILSGGQTAQNNEVCPSNETPAKFKARTGLTCYELCPPGKERDSTGQCVRACQNGTIRDQATGTCVART